MLKASREHLDEIGETYGEHLVVAATLSTRLAAAALGCLVHAIIPGLCTRAASRCLESVAARMARRHVARPIS